MRGWPRSPIRCSTLTEFFANQREVDEAQKSREWFCNRGGAGDCLACLGPRYAACRRCWHARRQPDDDTGACSTRGTCQPQPTCRRCWHARRQPDDDTGASCGAPCACDACPSQSHGRKGRADRRHDGAAKSRRAGPHPGRHAAGAAATTTPAALNFIAMPHQLCGWHEAIGGAISPCCAAAACAAAGGSTISLGKKADAKVRNPPIADLGVVRGRYRVPCPGLKRRRRSG